MLSLSYYISSLHQFIELTVLLNILAHLVQQRVSVAVFGRFDFNFSEVNDGDEVGVIAPIVEMLKNNL